MGIYFVSNLTLSFCFYWRLSFMPAGASFSYAYWCHPFCRTSTTLYRSLFCVWDHNLQQTSGRKRSTGVETQDKPILMLLSGKTALDKHICYSQIISWLSTCVPICRDGSVPDPRSWCQPQEAGCRRLHPPGTLFLTSSWEDSGHQHASGLSNVVPDKGHSPLWRALVCCLVGEVQS